MGHLRGRSTSRSARTLNVVAAAIMSCAAAGCVHQSDPVRSDPSTKKTGTQAHCQLLIGRGGLASRALAFTAPIVTSDPDGGYKPGKNPDAGTPLDRERYEVQEALFEIVATGDEKLANPVGQLVDFLDDPALYLADDDLTVRVERAGAKIRKVCGRS